MGIGDDIAKISILYDFYGALLPENQKKFLSLYHEEDYSLSETALQMGLSRQAVSEGIKKAVRTLENYEEALELAEKYRRREEVLSEVRRELAALAENCGREAPALRAGLERIEKSIEELGG